MSDQEVKQEAPKEDWMQKKWRPAMGWMYMVVCFCDMVIFPVAWSILQAVLKQPVTQWNPLTLQGAGLFHLAMGAVLGIAAWGRTQEKVAGASTVGTTVATPAAPALPVSPVSSTPTSMPPRPPMARPATVPVAARPADDEPPFNPRHRDD
jgi:hypothetical protein